MDDFYFTDEDRVTLGSIAETARALIHVRPCLRGEFDAWQSAIKSLAPGIGAVPEPPATRINAKS